MMMTMWDRYELFMILWYMSVTATEPFQLLQLECGTVYQNTSFLPLTFCFLFLFKVSFFHFLMYVIFMLCLQSDAVATDTLIILSYLLMSACVIAVLGFGERPDKGVRAAEWECSSPVQPTSARRSFISTWAAYCSPRRQRLDIDNF